MTDLLLSGSVKNNLTATNYNLSNIEVKKMLQRSRLQILTNVLLLLILAGITILLFSEPSLSSVQEVKITQEVTRIVEVIATPTPGPTPTAQVVVQEVIKEVPVTITPGATATPVVIVQEVPVTAEVTRIIEVTRIAETIREVPVTVIVTQEVERVREVLVTPTPTSDPRLADALTLDQIFDNGDVQLQIIDEGAESNGYNITPVLRNISKRTKNVRFSDQTFLVRTNLGTVIRPPIFFTKDIVLKPGESERLMFAQYALLRHYYEIDVADPRITDLTLEISNLSSIDFVKFVIPINH